MSNSLSRDKKGITLNLASEHGKDVLLRVDEHTAIVENFVPGTVAKLELGYEIVKHAACSGFG